MISRHIVNASPLIFLTKVGLLEVLHQQAVPVLVPDVVMAEISSLDAGRPGGSGRSAGRMDSSCAGTAGSSQRDRLEIG